VKEASLLIGMHAHTHAHMHTPKNTHMHMLASCLQVGTGRPLGR